MESIHGGDLTYFFEQWVYDTSYPQVSVGFTQQQAPSGEWQVQLSLAQIEPLTLPLEIWLERVDGSTEAVPVLLEGNAANLELSAGGRVRTVRPNPRHDAIVWSRSTQAGDATMSATVDGRDLIRCARLEGVTAWV